MAGRAQASCLPTSERPAEQGTGCSGATPPTAHRSFPALSNGRNRSSPVPRTSGHRYHLVYGGQAGAAPSLWPFPGAEVVLTQRGPCLPGTETPRAPRHIPGSGSEGGRQGWRRAGGGWGDTHRKRHCSWSCDSKKHRMPSSPPAIVAAATEQPGPLLGGWGRDVWAEGPGLHLGLQGPSWGHPMTHLHSHPDCWKSLVHPPCSCSWSPRCPFWAFSTQSS